MFEAVMQWAGSSDAPNGLLLLAAITSPAAWSKTVWQLVEERLANADAEAPDTEGGRA